MQKLHRRVWKGSGFTLRICFVSNYINHHQIPFCNAMCAESDGNFTFIQTQQMEAERVQMGWHADAKPEYVHCYYEEESWCRQHIMDCDVVLFGGCDDESYIEERLHVGKPVVRISERLYKTGQWKAVSPRGLCKKYHDHTRYRKAPVYLLCAGGYVASDFRIVHAYPDKMFCWGYFPETQHYDVDELMAGKGFEEVGETIPYLLWAARFIDWKHPELPLETAHYLKQKGYKFRLDIIGGGIMEDAMRDLLSTYELEDCVQLLGFKSPEEVRRHMEKADIYLFTSDRQEGWGAVANEAMNSGCAIVANHLIGAAPYLIEHGKNGYIYKDGKKTELFALAEKLVRDKKLCRQMGKCAYETITNMWNAENAAHSLMLLLEKIVRGEAPVGKALQPGEPLRPCVPAPVIREWGK